MLGCVAGIDFYNNIIPGVVINEREIELAVPIISMQFSR